jgi:4-hydroxy-tetrahydrodipicolinate synthase
MNKNKKYHGVVIPTVTPLTASGKIDRSSTEILINYIVDSGTFPFILGTTGEANSMTEELRYDFTKTVSMLISGKKTVYVGISDNCLDNSIRAARQFFDLGADVFVAHPPFYYPLNEDHLLKYFETLADKLPGPLIIYNIPSPTHISLSLNLIDKLRAHPNIVGLKDSERSMERIKVFAEHFAGDPEFSLLSGWTVQSAFALTSGFDGIVPSTGNYIPRLFHQLYQASKTDSERARQLQNIINPVAELHQQNRLLSEVIPALKVLLHDKGLCLPHVLPPLLEITGSEKKKIIEAVKQLQIGDYQ